MIAFLSRNLGTKQTTGQFVAFKGDEIRFECKTLEPQYNNNRQNNSCISFGDYIVKKHFSPTYGWCFKIQDTIGRTDILIHWGNYRRNTLGCILVGEYFADIDGDGLKDIAKSKDTFDDLMVIMPDEWRLIVRSSEAA